MQKHLAVSVSEREGHAEGGRPLTPAPDLGGCGVRWPAGPRASAMCPGPTAPGGLRALYRAPPSRAPARGTAAGIRWPLWASLPLGRGACPLRSPHHCSEEGTAIAASGAQPGPGCSRGPRVERRPAALPGARGALGEPPTGDTEADPCVPSQGAGSAPTRSSGPSVLELTRVITRPRFHPKA